jgi:hypothetical protein
LHYHNEIIFYVEWLLTPRPTPKVEEHLLSATGGCLFNVITLTKELAKYKLDLVGVHEVKRDGGGTKPAG